MRVVIQRSLHSYVEVDSKIVGEIPFGLVLLVGFRKDERVSLEKVVDKILHLRIFSDENGKLNRSILDVQGSILCISEFTLYGDIQHGNRPSFTSSMPYLEASLLYDEFVALLKDKVHVETGIFGADMKVSIINDGPVTLVLESEDL